MSFLRLAGALAPAALLAGCALVPFGGSGDPFVNGESGPVTIYVKNNNFQDATLTLITRGRRINLGTVTGKLERTFTHPVTSPADVWSLEIDLVGGDWCRTEELDVDPGAVLDLLIAVDVSRTPGCYGPGVQRPSD